jgi:hypothetical protein
MTTMNNRLTRWMVAAAVAAAGAGIASAQTYKADIPLSFRMGEKMMPAGSYRVEVRRTDSNVVVQMRDEEMRTAALAVGLPTGELAKAWKAGGQPMLAFHCAANTCVLRTMWNGMDPYATTFLAPRLPGEMRMAVVRLTPTKAD